MPQIGYTVTHDGPNIHVTVENNFGYHGFFVTIRGRNTEGGREAAHASTRGTSVMFTMRGFMLDQIDIEPFFVAFRQSD